MTASLEQVKKTIGDLLRLAENDAAAEGEVNNAIRFARRLMDAHHLSADECRNDPMAQAVKDHMDQAKVYSEGGKMSQWESSLSGFVCKFIGSVGCYLSTGEIARTPSGVIIRNGDGTAVRRSSVTFYGPHDDIYLATDLFDTLRQTIIAMARLKFGGVFRGPGRSYCEGFVSGLYSKLSAAKQLDEQSGEQSRALVVRSTAIAKETKARAEQWLRKEKGIKLMAGRSSVSGTYHGDAYSEGRSDGKSANVAPQSRRGKIGASQKQIGGA